MREMTKRLTVAVIISSLAFALCSCGSAKDSYYADTTASMQSNSYDYGYGTDSAAAMTESAEAYDMEMPEEDVGSYAESGAGINNTEVNDTVNKKLIKNASMNIETQDFDGLMAYVTEQTEKLGGYVQNVSTSGDKEYGSRYTNMTIRIPAAKLDSFLDGVAGQSNVINRSESVRDVTLEYVDLDAHKKTLTTQRDRLLELLSKAETMEDIIALESKLSDVTYQIESLESQIRVIDNQVDYSTVNMDINEVKAYTPTEKEGFFERISTGLSKNFVSLGEDIQDLIIGIIVSLPYLVYWAVLLGIVIFVIWLIVKLIGKLHSGKAKRKAKKMAKKQAKDEAYEVPLNVQDTQDGQGVNDNQDTQDNQGVENNNGR